MREIIIRQLDVAPDQLVPEARLMADLGADSLDIVEIGMKLEEDLELSLPDEELEGRETFGDLCQALAVHRSRQR